MRIPTISLSNPQSVRKSLLPAPVHVNFLSVAADESLVVGPRNLLRMRLRIQLEHSDVLRDASSQRPAQRGFFRIRTRTPLETALDIDLPRWTTLIYCIVKFLIIYSGKTNIA
jgi:hypothetical protein